MIRFSKKLIIVLLGMLHIVSCEEEEDNDFPKAASLKVVHASVGSPPIHVDYFGINDGINFSTNPTLVFGTSSRFTIPANEERVVSLVNSMDTTITLASQSVDLPAGAISTLYITGNEENVNTLLIEDNLITPIRDSITGVRFANLSIDSGPITVINVGETEEEIASSLDFEDFSDFIEFPSKVEDGTYNLEFRDGEGNTVANILLDPLNFSFTLNPFQFFNPPLKENITLILVGQADDGTGISNLSISRVDSF